MDKAIVQQALAFLGKKIDALTSVTQALLRKEQPTPKPTDMGPTNELLQKLLDKEQEDIEVTLNLL